MIKNFFIKYFPGLGKYKRFAYALKDNNSAVRNSYGQGGEDRIVYDLLAEHGIQKGTYVDVGANHPSTISNTYLLYRNGFRGIVVEPNPELIRLFKIFRPADIPLMVGCGEKAAILPFHISNTPVLSSFENTTGVIANMYLPILPLDDIMSNFEYQVIDFLSIDVEGLNIQVLKGAGKTLAKTRVVCIEYDNEEDIKTITESLKGTHNLYRKLPINLIFTHKDLLPAVKA